MKLFRFWILFSFLNIIFPSAQNLNSISGGIGNSSGYNFQIKSTVGQALVINTSESTGELESGFWPAANANLKPEVSFNSMCFNIMTRAEMDMSFPLIIYNYGKYPGNYYMAAEAEYGGLPWLVLEIDTITIAPEKSASIKVKIPGNNNFTQGNYSGYILVYSNTGSNRSLNLDSIQVKLTVLPDSSSIIGADTLLAAGDNSTINIIDSSGQELGLSLRFSESTGGVISAKFISATSLTDSSTSFLDPDSNITEPVFANCFWEIESNIKPGFSVDIGFDYSLVTELDNPDGLRLAKRPGYSGPETGWQIISLDSTNIEQVNKIITAQNQGSFSQWTLISEKNLNLFEDLQPPRIKSLDNIPEYPSAADSILVTALITDESSLDKVFLIYGRGGESINKIIEMGSNDTIYKGIIPAVDVGLNGLVYFVEALDQAGNFSRSDSQYLQINFDAEYLTSNLPGSAFPLGLPENKWRLISTPAELEQSHPDQIFGDELQGTGDNENWKILTWSGSDWVNVSKMHLGAASWILQKLTNDLTFSSGPGRSTDLNGIILSLPPGWNLIGAPFAFEIKLNIDPVNFYGPLTYGLNGEGWSSADVLKPWGGYAIFNRRNEYLKLHLKPGGSDGERKTAVNYSVINSAHKSVIGNNGEWVLQIIARGNIYQDKENFLGRIKGAMEKLDYFDNPEPPYVDGFISLSMHAPLKKGKGLNYADYSSDFRSPMEPNGIWNLNLLVNGEKGPVMLKFDLQGFYDPKMKILLLDLETRDVFNLKDNNEIFISDYSQSTNLVKYPYRFKIIAGLDSFVLNSLHEILGNLPHDVSLDQNYPNPFNSMTSIKFALPSSQMVTLKIYNILGQEVITLLQGWKKTGYYEISWNGRDSFGQKAASGLYFSILLTDKNVITRKMIMLR